MLSKGLSSFKGLSKYHRRLSDTLLKMLSDDIISVSDDHFRFSYGPTILSFKAL